MKNSRLVPVIASAFLLLSPTINADLIFQPPPKQTSKVETWRNAGAALFASTARVLEGLSAYEANDLGRMRTRFGQASDGLSQAMSLYKDLEFGSNSGALRPSDLAAAKTLRIFKEYNLGSIPKTEQEVAHLANAEVTNLLEKLKQSKGDLQSTKEVFAAAVRVQHLGMAVADLLGDSAEPR